MKSFKEVLNESKVSIAVGKKYTIKIYSASKNIEVEHDIVIDECI